MRRSNDAPLVPTDFVIVTPPVQTHIEQSISVEHESAHSGRCETQRTKDEEIGADERGEVTCARLRRDALRHDELLNAVCRQIEQIDVGKQRAVESGAAEYDGCVAHQRRAVIAERRQTAAAQLHAPHRLLAHVVCEHVSHSLARCVSAANDVDRVAKRHCCMPVRRLIVAVRKVDLQMRQVVLCDAI